jgi:hypothetical protein
MVSVCRNILDAAHRTRDIPELIMMHLLVAWHPHQHFDEPRNRGTIVSSFWSGDVGPDLVRTLRAKAQGRIRREGVTQLSAEITSDDMERALGRSRLDKDPRKTDRIPLSLNIARSTFELEVNIGSKAFLSAGSASISVLPLNSAATIPVICAAHMCMQLSHPRVVFSSLSERCAHPWLGLVALPVPICLFLFRAVF